MKNIEIHCNALGADPMDGHLYVVGRTSTPFWGKPGATRCCWDPPWQYRVATGASTVYHCRGRLASVATKVYLWPPRSARMRAVSKFHSLSLLLRAGDVHPNPGTILRIAQQNILGLTPWKKVSLLHKANILNLDVILLQELRITEDEASRLALPGFHCYSVARDAKGGGVAVLVRDALSSVLRAHSVSAAVEHITVCVKAGDEIAYVTSAYFSRANRVTPASILELSNDSWRAHIIGADSNAHHSMWDSYANANAGGRRILDFCVAQAYDLVNNGSPTRRDSRPRTSLSHAAGRPNPTQTATTTLSALIWWPATKLHWGPRCPSAPIIHGAKRTGKSSADLSPRTAKHFLERGPRISRRSSCHGASPKRQQRQSPKGSTHHKQLVSGARRCHTQV
ncbi:Endonuclease/exonuclease/phosphatase [Perkinsela sp. CCAP 1560/4]|nr:Endonuclease/exonuclease/phosphatase [Perkinsela sp. CCAP 1560/4]|eukprot:KNH05989.1 Endonuclease/exonuclease/phosphatase [Perkinsela sp. CCAP 1560/4]